jgi:hypothetical protein
MKKLIERQHISENKKALNVYEQLGTLLNALEVKELPIETIDFINQEIERLNSISDNDKNFIKATKKTENKIIQLVEKKHKIVPKNYYRKLWMILGMSSIGIPIGVAFGLSIGNLAMLSVGLPIGMAIGIGIGIKMDKKALDQGRQLAFEAIY